VVRSPPPGRKSSINEANLLHKSQKLWLCSFKSRFPSRKSWSWLLMADTSVIHSYHIPFPPPNPQQITEKLQWQQVYCLRILGPTHKEFEFIFLECFPAIASEMSECRSLFQLFPLIGRTQSPRKVRPQYWLRPISCEYVDEDVDVLCPSACHKSSNKPSWTCGLCWVIEGTTGQERWKMTSLL